MKKNFDDFLQDMKMENTSSLLISEPPMQFLPTLASVLSTDSVLFLQQLRFWMNHSNNIQDGRRWVYNSIDEWRIQFYWISRSTLKRIINTLKDFEYHGKVYHIIETRNLNANRMNQRLYYTINDSELQKLAVISRYERIRKVQKIIKGNRSLQERLVSGQLPARLLQNELIYDLSDFENLLDEHLKAISEENKENESETVDVVPIAQNESMGGKVPIAQNESMGESLNSRHWLKKNQSNSSNLTDTKVQNKPTHWFKKNQSTNIQENTKQENTQEISLSEDRAQKKLRDSPGVQDERKRLDRFRYVLIENGIKLGLTSNSMAELLHQYPESAISLAIQKAAENNARSLGYVKTLLENEDFSLRLKPSKKRRKERMPYEPAERTRTTDGESGDEWEELGRRLGYC